MALSALRTRFLEAVGEFPALVGDVAGSKDLSRGLSLILQLGCQRLGNLSPVAASQ